MLDLRPATDVLARLVEGVREEQLSGPTPCDGVTVAALLDHVNGLALGFTLAARKTEPEGGSRAPSADARRLRPDWRQGIPDRLAGLAEAWESPRAWTGMTRVGGVDLPGDVAGHVAVDELIVHAWDLAVATDQQADWADDLVKAAMTFVEASVEQNPEGTPGLFGPPVPVPATAPPMHHLLGLTGRDPQWRPPV